MSTLSNYILLALRMLCMVVLTRTLFKGLPAADYGFWALLWSVFAYALLLDFGLGTALQKFTSEWRAGNPRNYGEVMSTALFLYAIMAFGIAFATWGMASQLEHFLPGVKGVQLAHYRQAFLYFGMGSAVLFPTGCFAELLRGMEAIVLRNVIQGVATVAQLMGGLWAIHQTATPLLSLVIVTLVITLCANLTLAYAFYRRVTPLKWAWPKLAMARELLSFSVFAWIITLTNLVIFRTDQLVITSTMGLTAVAGYQIVQRLSDVFRQLTTQVHDVLGPRVARFYQEGNTTALKNTFFENNRYVFTAVSFMLIPLLWGLPLLLDTWLQLTDSVVINCGRILLISMAIQVAVRSTATQVMLMCQQEKKLMHLAFIEAIGNLVLSLLLIPSWGLMGVALGTLIPNIGVTFLGYLPLACRFLNLTMSEYLKLAFRWKLPWKKLNHNEVKQWPPIKSLLAWFGTYELAEPVTDTKSCARTNPEHFGSF